MCRRPLLLFIVLLGCQGPVRPGTVIPWAWERREDLRFAGAREIAYLAATISIDRDRVDTRPRLQPLRVADGASVIPVIRIEARHSVDLTTVGRVAGDIARITAHVHPDLIQIDFDATRSQRTWYAALLQDLRGRLEPSTRISITALASWCSDDRWMQALPIDEAVPMLFRMGSDARLVRARLRRGDDFKEPLCRTSLGIATDEPLDRAPAAGRRVYVFHTAQWDASAWRVAREEIARWE